MSTIAPWIVVVVLLLTAAAIAAVVRRDMRRTRTAERMQRLVATDLREVEELRSAFLRGISHELRTPLTNLVGYGETMQAHMARLEPDVIAHLTERMLVNAHRLERLVLDLLELDRLTVDDPHNHPAPVIVRELLQEVVDDLFDDRPDVVELSSTAGVLLIDPSRTRRIVHELLCNVLRHTEPGTRVAIRASVRDDRLHLIVEDDGPGIDVAVDDVFEPFVQGVDARSASSPGLGIGLALVRRYTELVGGTVRLEEPARGGTRVVVVLPALPALHAAPAPQLTKDRSFRPRLVGTDVLPPLESSLAPALGLVSRRVPERRASER